MPQEVQQVFPHAADAAAASGYFSCPICLEQRSMKDLFTPSGCDHRLCKACARDVVLNAARSLDFPIDCPVCRLDKPEVEEQVQQSAQQVHTSSSQHSSTLTAAGRSYSDNISAHLSTSQHVTEYILYSNADVDPDHATQLHAVASTPALGSTGHFDDSNDQQYSYNEGSQTSNGYLTHPEQLPPNGSLSNGFPPNAFPPNAFPPNGSLSNGFLPNGFPPNDVPTDGISTNGLPWNGLQPQQHDAAAHVNADSVDSPGSAIASPAYVSARPDHAPAVQLGATNSKKGMPRVPSFPILASGTPMTPMLVPASEHSLGSRAVFSPHLPSPAHSRHVAVSPGIDFTTSAAMITNHPTAESHSAVGRPIAEPRITARVSRDDDSAEVGMRSLSLGGMTNHPTVMARGLSSPADWLAEDYSRSSSLSSGISRGGSNVQQVRPLRSQRGSLDADVHMLLNEAELEEYLGKSLKAAAHRYGSLVQCPKADCDGVASLPQMEPHFQCPKCCYEWCRWCHGDWHEGIRCKKEPNYIQPEASGSRYIPEQAKPIRATHSRYIPRRQKESQRKGLKGKRGLSIANMGDLISRSTDLLKGTMENMKQMGVGDAADAGTSLNKYLKRNRVLECPTCKNGITKVEGGCNHIMCAVCKTHICWLCGAKICQGVNNYWDANRHFWIKGTKCYGQIQTVTK